MLICTYLNITINKLLFLIYWQQMLNYREFPFYSHVDISKILLYDTIIANCRLEEMYVCCFVKHCCRLLNGGWMTHSTFKLPNDINEEFITRRNHVRFHRFGYQILVWYLFFLVTYSWKLPSNLDSTLVFMVDNHIC